MKVKNIQTELPLIFGRPLEPVDPNDQVARFGTLSRGAVPLVIEPGQVAEFTDAMADAHRASLREMLREGKVEILPHDDETGHHEGAQ